MTADPALGIIEISSIARGVVVADAMAKKAPIQILSHRTMSPGKHLLIIAGGVAEVDEAMQAGLAAAGATIVDRLFLPQIHEAVALLLRDHRQEPMPPPRGTHEVDSLAVFETFTVCSTVLAADAAAKAAEVTLLEMRLGQHLGGKGFFTMTGTLSDVEAAVAAGRAILESGLLCGVEIIAAPHDDLKPRLFW